MKGNSMSEIRTIAIERILPNPHRDIQNYPMNKEKVGALVRSIQNGDIGLWPSIIARPAHSGYEMAFGHHRLKAAIEAGLKRIPLIVMKLTDEQMLQYMGRENGEEFGTDFMVLLNTWEAGVNFIASAGRGSKVTAHDVARLLGWMRFYQRAGRTDQQDVMTEAAQACNAALTLIKDGYMRRDEFQGMTVKVAQAIAQRTLSMMEAAERSGRDTKEAPQVTKGYKDRIASGARRTAAGVRAGTIAKADVGKQTDTNALLELGKKKGSIPKPLFDRFAYSLCADINKMVGHDSASVRLEEITKNLAHVELDADRAAIGAVRGSLVQLGRRAETWDRKITDDRLKDAAPNVAKLERGDRS